MQGKCEPDELEGRITEDFRSRLKEEEDQDVSLGEKCVQALTSFVEEIEYEQYTVSRLEQELQCFASKLKQVAEEEIGFAPMVVRTASHIFRMNCLAYAIESQVMDKEGIVRRCKDLGLMVQKSKETIADLLNDFLRDGVSILVHGYSKPVIHAIETAKSKGRRLFVYVPESRPKMEGYKAYKRLAGSGVQVKMIVDAACARAMKEVDFVLLGADFVCQSGAIVSKIGTFQLAVLAKELGKDVYVAVEGVKFSEEMSRDTERILDYGGAESAYKEIGTDKGTEFREYAYDFTPHTFIKLIFTDFGILTPSAVADEVYKLYNSDIQFTEKPELRSS